MNPWAGKALLFVWLVAATAIRVPHALQARKTKVRENRKGPLEIVLITLFGLGALGLPILAVATPLLAFADYSLRLPAFVAGVVGLVAGLWIFYRSHRDLGSNWSETLEIREQHAIVSSGVYAHIRHPMYASMFLMGVAQALYFPNWIAGPAGLLGFVLMFMGRLGPEEGMMLANFGQEYEAYRNRTKRLIPGVW